MAGYFGGDPEQMRTLAKTFDQVASRLEAIGSEVSGRLSATPWTGPDAERYRSQWQGQSMAKVRSVVSALREASASLQRNASEQETVSSAGGAGGVSGGAGGGPTSSGTNPLVAAHKWLGSSTIWPIQNSTLFYDTPLSKYVPLVDAVGLAAETDMAPEDKLRDAGGQLTDLGGGLLREAGGGKPSLNPLYLGGVAVSQWGDVIKEGSKMDLSASALQSNADFIASNPGGAFDAARDAVVNYIPKAVSNWF